MSHLALVRHGRTAWNRVGIFTGWADEDLDSQGLLDAEAAGAALASAGVRWEVAHVSALRRSSRTASVALAALEHPPASRICDWRLNERHVGALEGLRHADLAAAHGETAVARWRWGLDERPPLVAEDDPRQERHRARHRDLGSSLPRGESIADVVERFRPRLAEVRDVVAASTGVVAFTHGTTLRAIRMLIEGTAPEDAHRIRPANGSVTVSHHRGGRLHPTGTDPVG